MAEEHCSSLVELFFGLAAVEAFVALDCRYLNR